MSSNWTVCFNRNGRPGSEIPLGKEFHWGTESHRALSAYVCEEGLVLDFCTEIPRETEERFLEKWTPRIEQGLSAREERQLRQENPLNTWHHCQVWVNGEQIKNQHTSGHYWIPADIQPEIEKYPNETENYLEHYGLSRESVWVFLRVFCDWADSAPQAIASLEVKLLAQPAEIHGESFLMPDAGACVSILNPLTGQPHTLTVIAIQKESIIIPEKFAEYEMPAQATVMHYSLSPDLSHEHFQLKDAKEQDQARGKDGKPCHGGSVVMMLRLPKDGTHTAASSMRFTAPDMVEWEPVFRAKLREDITVTLL